MKNINYLLLSFFILFLSTSLATSAKVSSNAPCETLWNNLTKNEQGQAFMAFKGPKGRKTKMAQASKWLGKEDWLKACETHKKLGYDY